MSVAQPFSDTSQSDLLVSDFEAYASARRPELALQRSLDGAAVALISIDVSLWERLLRLASV